MLFRRLIGGESAFQAGAPTLKWVETLHGHEDGYSQPHKLKTVRFYSHRFEIIFEFRDPLGPHARVGTIRCPHP